MQTANNHLDNINGCWKQDIINSDDCLLDIVKSNGYGNTSADSLNYRDQKKPSNSAKAEYLANIGGG